MLYTPPAPNLRLWDTWLFRQGDVFHLFYLQRESHEIGCSAIGHAITEDWLRWETLPPVLVQGTGDAWDAGPLMTGMTLAHAGRYYTFYGAMVDQVQRIGVAVSDDLLTWEKVGNTPVLEAQGRWYETEPQQALNYETAWRDPYVFYHAPEACYYAFICARVVDGGDTGGGCIAVARSENLIDWTLLPPAYVSDSMTCLEVPEYFQLNDRHYLTFTTSYHFGTPYPVADAHQSTGTFYVVSDTMLEGYHASDAPRALNASLPDAMSNYVGRSIPHAGDPATRLYYYHNVYPPRLGESWHGSLSMPKLLRATAGGHLALDYAAGLAQAMFAHVTTVENPLAPDRALNLVTGDLPDGMFEAEVNAPYAGICFRARTRRAGHVEGLAAWLAPDRAGSARWYVMLGTAHFADGPHGSRPALGIPSALRALDRDLDRHAPPHAHLRVICRGPFVDVYVDDTLYLSHTYAPEAAVQDAGGAGAFYAGAPKERAVSRVAAHRFTVND